jgi:putative modified peptide
MANNKGPGPAPLHPDVANRVLDLLSTDDDFRSLFQRDPHAALVQAGHVAGDGPSGGECLQLAPGETLASKEQIAQDREKLQRVMGVPFSFSGSGDFRSA